MQAAVDTAVALGPLRIVVNCAGIATPGKVLGREGVLPLETFNRVIQVNLVGTFNVLRLAAAAMVGHGAGQSPNWAARSAASSSIRRRWRRSTARSASPPTPPPRVPSPP